MMGHTAGTQSTFVSISFFNFSMSLVLTQGGNTQPTKSPFSTDTR